MAPDTLCNFISATLCIGHFSVHSYTMTQTEQDAMRNDARCSMSVPLSYAVDIRRAARAYRW